MFRLIESLTNRRWRASLLFTSQMIHCEEDISIAHLQPDVNLSDTLILKQKLVAEM